MSSGFGKVKRSLRDMADDVESRSNKAVGDSLDMAEREAKRQIASHNAIASRILYLSFVQDRVPTSDGHRHTLTNIAPHAGYVEFGTGQQWGSSLEPVPVDIDVYKAPSMSPNLVAAIRRWILVKPTFIPQGNPNAIAHAIAAGIAGHVERRPSGTAPQPFMRPAAFKHVTPGGVNTVEHRVEKAVKSAVRGI